MQIIIKMKRIAQKHKTNLSKNLRRRRRREKQIQKVERFIQNKNRKCHNKNW